MRDIPIGNGSLLVNFDDKYQIRDIYFPHVGQENHSDGFPFRLGIWVDRAFSWVFDDGWERSLKYLPDTLVTDVILRNEDLGIDIFCRDTVAGSENIYLRRMIVKDTSGEPRNARVFLHHDFRIYENKVGDTAYYDPETLSLIHYKKHRYFLINTEPHFNEFATGRKAFHESEGTWRDAEDGELHGGAITEGSVDSTISLHFHLDRHGSSEFYYWIAAGTSHNEVSRLNQHVLSRRPVTYLSEMEAHWRNWLSSHHTDLSDLTPSIIALYDKSLLIVRTQIDNGGAVIAANDHDVIDRATDHYSYLWPRDGAFVANALDLAGFPEITRKFFELCGQIVHDRGYFLQKYNPDGSTGSGWHAAWDTVRGIPLVPIQEDETALVIWALWEHFAKYQNAEFARNLYDILVVRCGDFLADHIDIDNGLPLPSWNLWEDRRGVHTFTCATVVAGLRSAANFAREFNDFARVEKYSRIADRMVTAMAEHLYSVEHGRFLRSLQVNVGGEPFPDETVDASLFALFYFGCFSTDDDRVISTMAAIEENLLNRTEFGGVARFQNDSYMHTNNGVTGNSWFICTLWLAEYYIAIARSKSEMGKAFDLLEWVTERAMPSGVLSEQIDPKTGEHLSVSPLTWSHSTFVATVISYQAKMRELGNKSDS